ncbi:MAG: rRNA maturation RNase YbeY [Verrucomicrobiae bacterium]|nr:rRNA maturation RNase YbeY [Verrucomicrobiae bacterium]
MPTNNTAAPASRREPLGVQVTLRNQQKDRRINPARFKRLATLIVARLAPGAAADLCVHLVSSARMARLNEHFLGHTGPTDVITFDLSEGEPGWLYGEIFICPRVALAQAHEYACAWQEELMRYFIHGVLHLLGHDDQNPAARRRMKAAENRALRWLLAQHSVKRLGSPL